MCSFSGSGSPNPSIFLESQKYENQYPRTISLGTFFITICFNGRIHYHTISGFVQASCFLNVSPSPASLFLNSSLQPSYTCSFCFILLRQVASCTRALCWTKKGKDLGTSYYQAKSFKTPTPLWIPHPHPVWMCSFVKPSSLVVSHPFSSYMFRFCPRGLSFMELIQ